MLPGILGITLSHVSAEPKNKSRLADIQAAETYNNFNLGWFANPIFGNGDYPDVLKSQINNKSLEQGYNVSRLPVFTEEEKTMLKGWRCIHILSRNAKSVFYATSKIT